MEEERPLLAVHGEDYAKQAIAVAIDSMRSADARETLADASAAGVRPDTQSAEVGKARRGSRRCRRCIEWFCCLLIIGVVATLASYYTQPKAPVWKVETVVLDRIDVPGLWIDGIVSADASNCPIYDPCGLTLARGCTRCPHEGDINRGCLCSVEGGSVGMLVKGDTTACPFYDKCGLFVTPGCVTCPDDSFVHGGCLCHRPMDYDDLKRQANDFYELITGEDEYPLQVRLRTDMQVTNPNVVHASTEPGNISVTWKGHQIGSSTIRSLSLPPGGRDDVVLEVDVDQVSKQLGYQMMKELLSNSYRLGLEVEGMVVADVMRMRIETDIQCVLVAEIHTDGSSAILESKCSYSYRGLNGAFEIAV